MIAPAPPQVGPAEFAERQERTRRAIADAGLDGLLAWGTRDMCWAVRWLADHQSGFATAAGFGDKGNSALVLPVDGDPILVLDQRVGPGDVAIEDARTFEVVTEGIAEALRETGLAGKAVGIAGEGAMLDRNRRHVEARLGTPLALQPADAIVEPLHRVKSETELELMRHASAVGCAWMSAMMEAAEPGRTEADLVLAGLPVLINAGGWPTDVVIGSGNPCKPQAPRGIPSFNATRPMERGDLLRVDGFGPVRGYGCDMARSTCVGAQPTAAQRAVLEDAVGVIEAMIAAVRPGVTHEQVHDVGTRWMTDRGYPPHGYFEGFFPTFGHQLGLTTEGPWIAAGSTDPIRAGQVMAIEIVLGTPETGGIAYEDVVIVHDDGVEVITAPCPARWW
ncbi:MAG TPA: Xaa-Pro peptidase family protein [Solirubrobacteraceae bacterium]|nr:Xaa-Pro peptidase family protein [Solirubrobacteraceae bacterium]